MITECVVSYQLRRIPQTADKSWLIAESRKGDATNLSQLGIVSLAWISHTTHALTILYACGGVRASAHQ